MPYSKQGCGINVSIDMLYYFGFNSRQYGCQITLPVNPNNHPNVTEGAGVGYTVYFTGVHVTSFVYRIWQFLFIYIYIHIIFVCVCNWCYECDERLNFEKNSAILMFVFGYISKTFHPWYLSHVQDTDLTKYPWQKIKHCIKH